MFSRIIFPYGQPLVRLLMQEDCKVSISQAIRSLSARNRNFLPWPSREKGYPPP